MMPVYEQLKVVAMGTRLCWDCEEQITRHHKYYIGVDGRLHHRNCDDPVAYVPDKRTVFPREE